MGERERGIGGSQGGRVARRAGCGCRGPNWIPAFLTVLSAEKNIEVAPAARLAGLGAGGKRTDGQVLARVIRHYRRCDAFARLLEDARPRFAEWVDDQDYDRIERRRERPDFETRLAESRYSHLIRE